MAFNVRARRCENGRLAQSADGLGCERRARGDFNMQVRPSTFLCIDCRPKKKNHALRLGRIVGFQPQMPALQVRRSIGSVLAASEEGQTLRMS